MLRCVFVLLKKGSAQNIQVLCVLYFYECLEYFLPTLIHVQIQFNSIIPLNVCSQQYNLKQSQEYLLDKTLKVSTCISIILGSSLDCPLKRWTYFYRRQKNIKIERTHRTDLKNDPSSQFLLSKQGFSLNTDFPYYKFSF
jgi:hypothetical protein